MKARYFCFVFLAFSLLSSACPQSLPKPLPYGGAPEEPSCDKEPTGSERAELIAELESLKQELFKIIENSPYCTRDYLQQYKNYIKGVERSLCLNQALNVIEKTIIFHRNDCY